MAKTCPRCGTRYPDTAVYCDQDGATLAASPAAPRSRRGRRVAVAVAVAVLLCLATGAALPRMIERYLRLRIGVVLDEVRYPSNIPDLRRPGTLQGLLDRLAGLADLLTGTNKIAVHLRVRNDTPLQVSLVSTTYTITVEGVEAASGVWNPDGKPVLFAPGDEITAEISIPPSPEAGVAIGRALLDGHRPEIKVHGQLTVDALWTTFTLPFEVNDLRIDLESPDSSPEPAAPAPETRDDGPRQVV
jgi:hypothetical protein